MPASRSKRLLTPSCFIRPAAPSAGPATTISCCATTRQISRLQALLQVGDDACLLKNLSSVSTIEVNREPVGYAQERPLNTGDIIRIGPYVLRAERDDGVGRRCAGHRHGDRYRRARRSAVAGANVGGALACFVFADRYERRRQPAVGASPGSSRATRQAAMPAHGGGPAAGCRATGEPRGANRTARPFTARPAPAVDRSARSVRAAVGRYRHIRHIRHIRHDGHGTACRSRPHGARSVVRDRPTMRPSGRNTCGCSPLPRARMRSRPTNRRRMPRARRRPMNC